MYTSIIKQSKQIETQLWKQKKWLELRENVVEKEFPQVPYNYVLVTKCYSKAVIFGAAESMFSFTLMWCAFFHNNIS